MASPAAHINGIFDVIWLPVLLNVASTVVLPTLQTPVNQAVPASSALTAPTAGDWDVIGSAKFQAPPPNVVVVPMFNWILIKQSPSWTEKEPLRTPLPTVPPVHVGT